MQTQKVSKVPSFDGNAENVSIWWRHHVVRVVLVTNSTKASEVTMKDIGKINW